MRQEIRTAITDELQTTKEEDALLASQYRPRKVFRLSQYIKDEASEKREELERPIRVFLAAQLAILQKKWRL